MPQPWPRALTTFTNDPGLRVQLDGLPGVTWHTTQGILGGTHSNPDPLFWVSSAE